MYYLNKYSNALIITYIVAFVAMQIGTQSSIFDGLTSLPIIILVVFGQKVSLRRIKRGMFI